MSMIADMIRAMAATGATIETIAAAVEVIEQAEAAKAAAKDEDRKAKQRERTARCRARKSQAQQADAVTAVTDCNVTERDKRDVTDESVTVSPKGPPHTPPKYTPNLLPFGEAPIAADAAPLDDPSIAERELFSRGKEVLGKTAGGLITKLLKAKGRNVALARAAIEQASTKENPREFIGRVIAGQPTNGSQYGGCRGADLQVAYERARARSIAESEGRTVQ